MYLRMYIKRRIVNLSLLCGFIRVALLEWKRNYFDIYIDMFFFVDCGFVLSHVFLYVIWTLLK